MHCESLTVKVWFSLQISWEKPTFAEFQITTIKVDYILSIINIKLSLTDLIAGCFIISIRGTFVLTTFTMIRILLRNRYDFFKLQMYKNIVGFFHYLYMHDCIHIIIQQRCKYFWRKLSNSNKYREAFWH